MDGDPKIAFILELLGPERTSKGELIQDWLDCRVQVEIFNQRLERPGPNTLHEHEIRALIDWLRKLTEARDPVKPFVTIEPVFEISAEPIAGPTFTVTVMITAYGAMPDYYFEDIGVQVDIPTDEASIREFAKQLELELATTKG